MTRVSPHITNDVTFRVLHEDVSDTGLKTQIAAAVLVEGDVTSVSLERLLVRLFTAYTQRVGFQYRVTPNSIYIWAYPSEAHYRSGAGQWVAMISRSAAATTQGQAPTLTVSHTRLAALRQQPMEHFGLPEELRRLIFQDVCRIENAARIAPDAAHPVLATVTREELEQHVVMKRRLIDEGKGRLARAHALDVEQLTKIVVEGLEFNWPMANLNDVTTATI